MNKIKKSVSDSPKAWTFGSNVVGGAIGNATNLGFGNPVGGAIYGGLAIAEHLSPAVRSHYLARITKGLGALWYGLGAVGDVFGLINGDASRALDLPFDFSMAYILGKDTLATYNSGNDVGNDVKTAVNEGKAFHEKVREKMQTKDKSNN